MQNRPSSTRSQTIFIATTSSISLDNFNRTIIPALIKNGWTVTGCCGPTPAEPIQSVRDWGARVVIMPLVRHPSLFRDIWCLFRFLCFFLFHRFDVIHASTPKAMLLVTTAAFLTGQRKRLVVFRGRAYENQGGKKRFFFVLLDRLVARLAHRVVVVSASLKEALLADRIGTPEKLLVLGDGSSKGVDSTHYSLTQVTEEQKKIFCEEHGICADRPIVLFVGRVREDKGINELVEAFVQLQTHESTSNTQLLITGERESVGNITPFVNEELANNPSIIVTGRLTELRPAYALANMVVLPTWREGFPNVALETAAMERPLITTDAVGAVDSVIHDKTGLIIPAHSPQALCDAMVQLLESPETSEQMGQAGLTRVREKFSPDRIQGELFELL